MKQRKHIFKDEIKFTCYDCGLPKVGQPKFMLRPSKYGPGVVRVPVCKKCLG